VLTDNGRTGMPAFQQVQLSPSGPNRFALLNPPRHTVPWTGKLRTNACPMSKRTS